MDMRGEMEPGRHRFLPPDEDANVRGYWVPSPEEIRAEAAAIRAGVVQINGHSGRRVTREYVVETGETDSAAGRWSGGDSG